MKILRSLRFVLLFTILAADPLRAQYLDPGTGSYILQILLAAGLASLFYIKQIITFLKAFFKKRFSKTSTEEKKNG